MKTTIGLVALLLVLFVIANTRIGVFFVFDVLGDVGSDNLPTDPSAGPLQLTQSLQATTKIPLPESIEQASGIHVSDGLTYVSTDQAELFVLETNVQRASLIEQHDLLGGPLLFKQGSVEAIQVQDNVLMGIGELGGILNWQIEPFQATADVPLDLALADKEFTGLTVFQGAIYASSDEGLVVYNLTTGQRLSLDVAPHLKKGRSADEVLLSGLTSDAEHLYAITENYASILRIDPDQWQVTDVIGIDAGEASDIAVHNEKFYITVDHNYFDPRPPLHIYDL